VLLSCCSSLLPRLNSVLLVLYPKAFRRRYSEEIRRDFRELTLEGLQEGGTTELVGVLAQAFSDLVLTALKERGTTAARRYAYYFSLDPRIAARAAARAMVAVVLVAVGVSEANLWQAPTYEASAQAWVDQKQGDQEIELLANQARSGEMIKTLPPSGEDRLQTIILTMIHAIDSRPVAEEAIQRLGLEMSPAELLDNLAIEQVESTSFIVLTYESNDPVEATKIVNTVGQVSSELISERSAPALNLRAIVYEEAMVPESPVGPKPLRNGLLTLVLGLVLCGGLVVALPGVAASVAGKLGRPTVTQGDGQVGLPGGRHGGPSQADVIKERAAFSARALREANGGGGGA
jgi:capsular polysaccharide biosynthesis protein